LRDLARLTWPEAEQRSDSIVAVPLGSFEQHGPHLPLDTDSRIASAVAQAVVEVDETLILGPVVALGASGEHDGFPGTLSVGVVVVRDTIVELVRSADHFAGVVLVNAHGGNRQPIAAAVELLESEGRRVLATSCRAQQADAHAGFTETSLMLHLDPSAVHVDLIEPGDPRPWSEIASDLVASGVASVSSNGVLGDPTGATADAGAAIFDEMVRAVLDDLEGWGDG
jgi:mycofactocin system creatininase family protein